MMRYIISVIKDDGKSSTVTFPNYKIAKKHYGRMINERNTVSAILRDDKGNGRDKLRYDRGMVR